ncbi:hypothetical protein C6Y40_23670 [Alteromonas alba]|uniref:Uncharacterized protein n=1 Tax=Alteromonas alba TaxID=2079529 RepID=A0A2S9V3Z2_9ALTE|nr:hypothetical protein [Alteromonadaceae bacterium]PRO71151.1 hypothetical protein C6Y40_23670 [Alteromonas alba]
MSGKGIINYLKIQKNDQKNDCPLIPGLSAGNSKPDYTAGRLHLQIPRAGICASLTQPHLGQE